MRRYIVLIITILLVFSLNGQVIYKQGKPLMILQKEDIPKIELPALDLNKLKEQDAEKPLPYRVGINVNLERDFKKIAQKIEYSDKNIWYLRITSPNGIGLGVIFDDFKLPEGAELYFYSPDKTIVFGPITEMNNKAFGVLATREFHTLDLIIEYQEPKNVSGSLRIKDIVQFYRGFTSKGVGDSQDCEVNINCPEGAAWQTEKHAVAKYTFKSGVATYMCSGALIANTARNDDPYFFTANHCVSSEASANSATFYFNFEADGCTDNPYNSGQTLSGATLIASGEVNGTDHLDFTLMKLSAVPPPYYEPYYAGWSRVSTTSAIDSSVCIHHPAGDLKKISKDFDSPGIGSFSGYDPNTHWQIYTWDLGTTEGGSSGSPLFDQTRHIIGDLTGGEASCDYNHNDYFAQFFKSWDTYSDSTDQLRYWLDPLGINPAFLDGYDPYAPTSASLKSVSTIYGYTDEQNVYLFWLAPDEINDSVFYDGFEVYDDFALSIPYWTQKDLDKGPTWGIEGISFPNENYIGAFIVFNPAQTDPKDPTGWEPHSGYKYLACFSTQTDYGPNNDWLISPKIPITASSKVVFYAKSVSDRYNLERIRVLVSEKTSDVNDFIPISSEPYIEVPAKWTRYEFDLSNYQGSSIYIAINVVSENGFSLLLDDFSVTTGDYPELKTRGTDIPTSVGRKQISKDLSSVVKLVEPQLISYYLYKDFERIAELPPNQKYYTDFLTQDLSRYYVIAIYDSGRAAPSDIVTIRKLQDTVTIYEHDNELNIYPNPVIDGNITIRFNRPVEGGTLRIYSINGILYKTVTFSNTREIKLHEGNMAPGLYYVIYATEKEVYKTVFINL